MKFAVIFQKPRICLVGGLVLFLYITLILNLYNIQIKKGDYYNYVLT